MSIDNITGKILAEAESQNKLVLEEAGDKSRKIIDEAKRQADKIKDDYSEKIKEDAALTKSRRISVAELEVRKLRLGAKQDQIKQCFDVALDRMVHMEENEYLELLAASIFKIGGSGGELMLNKDDRGRIGEKLIHKVNKTGKVGELSLSKDVIDAKGGFVLKRGSMEINSTLETMINGIRESATPDVVEALYG
jgi:V/A-type H+-transporting ATPase subunit E